MKAPAGRPPASASALRREAEVLARRIEGRPGQDIKAPAPEALPALLHELRVHQIELEMQNDELRRTQADLDSSHARYFDLYDLAPVGYCSISAQGLIQQANLTAAKLLTVPRGQLIGQPLSRFICREDQDRFYLLRRQLLQTEAMQSTELRLLKSDGASFWADLTASLSQDDGGAAVLRVVLHDADERRGAQQALAANQAFTAAVLDSLSEQIAVLDAQGLIVAVNEAWRRFGQSQGAGNALAVGTNYLLACTEGSGMANAQERMAAADGIREVLTGRRSHFALEYQHRAPDCWIGMQVSPMLGEHPGVVISLRDISDRMQVQQQLLAGKASLRESGERMQDVLDKMADGFIIIDVQGRVDAYNKAACSIFGYTPGEVLGRNVAMLMPEPHRSHHDLYLQHYQRTGDARVVGKPREVAGLRKNGQVFPMSLSVSEVNHAGRTTFVALVRDITQDRQHSEEIHRLAFYDPLTGLPNRRLLMDRLKQAMAASSRTGMQGALMFLDLDHFKRLNDSLGHDVGDLLLQQVAARLSACVREGDSVARLGGDEFVLLIETISCQAAEAATQAEIVANKILHSLGQPYSLRGHQYSSTPSIGIVLFVEERDSLEELLKKADVAMYQAKAAGRNTARFFDPEMQATVTALTELERDMRRGLARQEFLLHYQVQVDGQGRPIGAEALVRWQHPEKGLLLPARFIALAEDTGMIVPLGRWVLETACAQLRAWAASAERATWTMAVNISAAQVAQPGFVDEVIAALHGSGANPLLLKLELTESLLVENVEEVIAKFNAIKAQGVGFSIDDFGTGFSSLMHLKRLPLDQIKIDRSFVHDLLTDGSDAVIAGSIIALGHSLGLTVIAEGVETRAQRDFLAGIGCNAFQGYFFGRPVPAQELPGR
nr:EAL domain-containing protein [uncultured Roseateles sp.]